jgi:hypothetical protein
MTSTDPLTSLQPATRSPVVEGQASPDIAALLSDAMQRIADLEARVTSLRPPPAARGAGGRPAVNLDIAAFANRHRPAMTWKDICRAWKHEHPHDPRNEKLRAEHVRDAWRRHCGRKGKRHA